MNYTKYLLLLLPLLVTWFLEAQVSVMPNHANILYTGRFAMYDQLNPSFSMNGASIKINFYGQKIDGRFSSKGGTSYLYVIIDGHANPLQRQILEIDGLTESIYIIADDLSEGVHSLELVKLNESETKISFHGFMITGSGLAAKPTRPIRQLEFIGDSNTAGWSAWDAYDRGGGHTSGAYYTFPGITSRLLKAEFSLIGGSGSCITDCPSWNLTRFYDLIHLQDDRTANNEWDFNNNYWGFRPDAVIVNLGANDYYADISKQKIKEGWKCFITQKLRKHYPQTHIVLANSYGWAYNEPADYVHEAIAELKAEGDSRLSFVRFPWLWGQSHAVINEHAGFANLLAKHLAEVLNWETPEPSPLTSFVAKGEIYNGSFEVSTLPGTADGWRPHGKANLIQDASVALDGNKVIRLEDGGWVNFSTEVEIGDSLVLTGWGKAKEEIHSGFFKIEFKDQAQKTIKTQQIQPDFSTDWQAFTTAVKIPEGSWSAWVILAADNGSIIDFDNISLEMHAVAEPPILPTEEEIKIFPNPTKDYIQIIAEGVIKPWEIFSAQGVRFAKFNGEQRIDTSSWPAGVYFLHIPAERYAVKFVKY